MTPRDIVKYFNKYENQDEELIIGWWEKRYDIPNEVWGAVVGYMDNKYDWSAVDEAIGDLITINMK